MKLFIKKNKTEGDKKAFKIIKNQVENKPNLFIGLAVGKTTDGLYNLISKDAKKHPHTWRKIKILQIDENFGLSPKNKKSFNYEIRKELKILFKLVDTRNIYLMDGTKKPEITIKETNKFIRKNKGIDLIILGLGPSYDPHIAYNTTGKSALNSRMRLVDLHPKTSKKLGKKTRKGTPRRRPASPAKRGERGSPMAAWRAPTKGITLGIKNILESKMALLIAYGKEKAKSLKYSFNGKVNMKRASASALQLHKDLTMVIDKEAAKLM